VIGRGGIAYSEVNPDYTRRRVSGSRLTERWPGRQTACVRRLAFRNRTFLWGVALTMVGYGASARVMIFFLPL
jgi:hypothetical protein